MRTYILALSSVVLLFIGNALGEWLLYYDKLPGYDIPMHILGGFAVAVFVAAVLEGLKIQGGRRFSHAALMIVGVLLLSLVWEIFEAVTGASGNPFGTVGYILDTSKDFINALIGSVAAIIVVQPSKKTAAVATEAVKIN